jgi:hypothetical protein
MMFTSIMHSWAWFTKLLLDGLDVNTSGKAGAQILHLPLGDDPSPSGESTVGR